MILNIDNTDKVILDRTELTNTFLVLSPYFKPYIIGEGFMRQMLQVQYTDEVYDDAIREEFLFLEKSLVGESFHHNDYTIIRIM